MPDEHSPGRHRPLGGYAALTGTFLGSAGAFSAWMHASGRELPDRVAPGDLALVTVATHKAARRLARDRVPSTAPAPPPPLEHAAPPPEATQPPPARGLPRPLRARVPAPLAL